MTTTNKNLNQPTLNSQSWNVPLNDNFGYIDKALGSTAPIYLSGLTDYTMSTSEAQNLIVSITGTIGTSSSPGNVNVKLPDNIGGFWIVINGTSDSVSGTNNTVTFKTTSGSGVVVTRGYATIVYDTGSSAAVGNVLNALSDRLSIAGGTLIGNLIVGASSTSGSTFVVNNTGAANALVVSGGSVSTVGNITASGNVTAYSDQRLKEDIRTIDDAISIVKQLRGVSYINKSTKAPGVGVVAQEVLDVLPAVVHHDDNGFMHVAYGNIIGVLINAIKELSVRVEELEQSK